MRKYILSLLACSIVFFTNAQVFTASSGSSVGQIPDNTQYPNCFPLTVSGVGVINNTYGLNNVTINITHPYVADLKIWLKAPDGTTVLLADKYGGSGQNYTNTVFIQTAPLPISAGVTPFTGQYVPDSSIGQVNNGQSADGIWSLCVQDISSGDSGILVDWSLTFNNIPATTKPVKPTCRTNAVATGACSGAPLVCDFQGFCGNTSSSYAPPHTWGALTTAFCGSIENNSFIKFVAGATTATFNVWVYNSQNNDGIQMFFWSGGCNGTNIKTYGCINPLAPSPDPTVATATGLTVGQTYYLMFDGFAGDVCDYTVSPLTGVSFVDFSVDPATSNVCKGTQVTLTAQASGSGPVTFDWSNITVGASSISLGLDTLKGPKVHVNTSVLPVGVSIIKLQGPNTGACPNTKYDTIRVVYPPTITSQPSPVTQIGYVNANVSPIKVVVSDTGVTYQWYVNNTNSTLGGTLLPGATTSIDTPQNIAPGTYYYYCIINNGGCKTVSAVAEVIMKVPPVCNNPDSIQFIQQPTNTPQSLAISPAITIREFCSATGLLSTEPGFVTLSASDGGCGYISQTKPFVNGIATFDSVVFTRSLQNNITLTAKTTTGFAPAIVSKPFNITKPIITYQKTIIKNDNFENTVATPLQWRPTIPYSSIVVGTLGTKGVDVAGIVTNNGNSYFRKSYSINNNTNGYGTKDTFYFPPVNGLSTVDTVNFSFKLASLDAGGLAGITVNNSGVDAGEDLVVETSTDGGLTWKMLLTHRGGTNKLFDFANTTTLPTKLSIGANTNYTAASVSSAFKVTFYPKANGFSQFQFRVTASNNRINENWCIDDILLDGTTIVPGVQDTMPTVVAKGDTTFCGGGVASLYSVPSNAHAPVTYAWSPASGFSVPTDSTVANPTTKALTTSQTYSLAIIDNDNCPAKSNDVVINTSNKLPTIQAEKLLKASICVGGNFDTLSVTAIDAFSYQWFQNTVASNTGGTLIAGATNNTFIPSSASIGKLYYYCEVKGACGSVKSKISGEITVNSKPIVKITGNTVYCIGLPITLSANGADTYSWIGGPSLPDYTLTPTVNTSIAVIGTKDGCTDTAKFNVVVDSSKKPSVNVIQPTCTIATGVISIISPTVGLLFSKDALIYDTTTSFKNLAAGTYYIAAKNANGCLSKIDTITILAQPTTAIVSLKSTTDSCLGNSVLSVSHSSSDSLITWLNNGSLVYTSTSTVDTVYKPITVGTYTVNVISKGGCTSSSNVVSVVNSLSPSIIITAIPNTTICPGTKVSFTSSYTSGGAKPSLQWYKNGLLVDTASTYISSSFKDGDTVYCILKSNAPCAIPDSAKSNVYTVRVNSIITPSFNLPATICSGSLSPVLPNKSNEGISGKWSPVTVDSLNSGVYTFTPDSGGCAIPVQVTIAIKAKSKISFSAISPICNGSMAPILPTLSNEGVKGVWSPAQVDSTKTSSYVFTPDANQCADTASILVTVIPSVKPSITISSSATTICPSTVVTFTANIVNGGTTPTYDWLLNGVSTGTNNSTYSNSLLKDGDSVICILTNNAVCANSIKDTSNKITIQVKSNLSPTFTLPSTICSGSTAPVLPTTSNEGVVGSWIPLVVDVTKAGTYTFTPTSSSCASPVQYSINIDVQTKPTFAAILPICSGTTAPILPAKSIEGINGTWFPAIVDTTKSATYVFTPDANQCADTASILVTVTQSVKPSISISSSATTICPSTLVTFTATIVNGGATPIYDWQVNGVSTSSSTSTYSSSILKDGDIVSCILTNNAVCATTLKDTSNKITIQVKSNLSPTFTLPSTICSGSIAPVLPTTSNEGVVGSWIPAVVDIFNSGTYTFTPTSSSCASPVNYTISIAAQTKPTFASITPICNGSTAPILPSTSLEGIKGTWTPSTVDNTKTASYLFTPDANQCASTANLTVNIIPSLVPTVSITSSASTICPSTNVTFTATASNGGISPIFQWQLNGVTVGTNSSTYSNATLKDGDIVTTILTSNAQCAAPVSSTSNAITIKVQTNIPPTFNLPAQICSGSAAPILPTTSNEGVQGTWSPATVNVTSSGTYTFTPINSSCAAPFVYKVTITPQKNPTFTFQTIYCAGSPILTVTLPTTSSEGIIGTWSPSAIDPNNSANYTFTPNTNQCASVAIVRITISPKVSPSFAAIPTICSGSLAPILPTTSTNSISGTWSPAKVDSTKSASYTFTPALGVCASTAVLPVVIQQKVTPSFNAIAPLCKGKSAPLLATLSNEGVTGTWLPPTIDNLVGGTYNFTPSTGSCATNTNLSVTIIDKPSVDPTTGPTTVEVKHTITLSNLTVTPPATTAAWSITPSTVASINPTGVVTGILPGVAIASYTLSNACGDSSTLYRINVSPLNVFIPNTFSPNGDSHNDLFYIRGDASIYKKVEFRVFNSWGGLVYEVNGQIDDRSLGWDGSFKGKPQPTGVYIYVAKITNANGETEVKKGTINLIR